MEEFNTLEKVINLFKNVNGYGENNTIFVAYKDMQKSSGMLSGMNYPYEGLLINQTENGIGMFYLQQSGLVLTQNVEKMTLNKEQYTFIAKKDIKKITIKNYALLNSKIKRISIDVNDGRSFKLFAKLNEKNIPYQTENFANFINNQANN